MKKFSIIILTLSVCFASGNHQSQLEKLMISLQEKYQVYTPDDLYKLKSRNPSVNHRNSTRDMSDIVGEWYVEEENAKMFITVGTDQIIPNIGQMMAMEEAQGSVQISAAAGSTTTFETELTYILDGSIMGDGDNDDSEISIGLIKDTDPWGGALNEQVLQEFDMEYDLIDRWMLMDLNLSYYDLIIVASDQPQELYDVFDSRLSDLEAFVTSGGTLQFNGADQGWNGSFWYELPGGVTHVNSGSYYNYVVDSNHPITEGIPSEIYANTASHCFLQDYPANTHFIMNDESGEYTLIEYELGDGLVLTTGITLDSPNNDNIFFQILTNMIDYSINQSVDLVSIKPTDESLPGAIKLHAAYPNPFNPITTLRYDLPENSLVNITIYDMLGRQVKTLINQTQDAGFKSVIWDATNDYGKPVSAGVYLYQIQAGEFVQTKKMVLLK